MKSRKYGEVSRQEARVVETYSGDVTITKENRLKWIFTLQRATRIMGSLTLQTNVTLPHLQVIGGNLVVERHISARLQALEWVGGSGAFLGEKPVDISSLRFVGRDFLFDGPVNTESLEKIGGNLDVRWGAKMPNLIEIGGNLTIHHSYKFLISSPPSLGKNLYIDGKQWNLQEAVLERRILIIDDF